MVRYRYNCEQMKLEITKYIEDAGVYDNKNEVEKRRSLFSNLNKIVDRESEDWKELRNQERN